jgi:hypothetical protein
MQLADTDDLALWYALNRLMTNYWADVDGNSGSQAHEVLFVGRPLRRRRKPVRGAAADPGLL